MVSTAFHAYGQRGDAPRGLDILLCWRLLDLFCWCLLGLWRLGIRFLVVVGVLAGHGPSPPCGYVKPSASTSVSGGGTEKAQSNFVLMSEQDLYPQGARSR